MRTARAWHLLYLTLLRPAASTPDEMQQVRGLLHRLKLAAYAPAFEAAGYDDLDFLLDLSPEEAQKAAAEIGIKKPGHVFKLLRYIERHGKTHGTTAFPHRGYHPPVVLSVQAAEQVPATTKNGAIQHTPVRRRHEDRRSSLTSRQISRPARRRWDGRPQHSTLAHSALSSALDDDTDDDDNSSALGICLVGIRNGTACCPTSCDRCAESGCPWRSNQSDGKHCCAPYLQRASRRLCQNSTDVACRLRKRTLRAAGIFTSLGLCAKGVPVQRNVTAFAKRKVHGRACCPAECGGCGGYGSGCSSWPGGRRRCCARYVELHGAMCEQPEDVACYMTYTEHVRLRRPAVRAGNGTGGGQALAGMALWTRALSLVGAGCESLLLSAIQSSPQAYRLVPPSHPVECSYVVVNALGVHHVPGWTQLLLTPFSDLELNERVLRLPLGLAKPTAFADKALASRHAVSVHLAPLAAGMDVAIAPSYIVWNATNRARKFAADWFFEAANGGRSPGRSFALSATRIGRSLRIGSFQLPAPTRHLNVSKHFFRTVGKCRGGPKWAGAGVVWNCTSASLSNEQCATACRARPGCDAYDRRDGDGVGGCCLFRAGSTGDGETGRACHQATAPSPEIALIGGTIAGLVISTPQRYERAAREARLAGLAPVTRVNPKFVTESACPGMTAGEFGLAVAMRRAITLVATSGRPAVVFEDDIVLLTSADSVLSYTSGAAFQRFPEFDLVWLGACGNFGCAHSILWTPKGARLFLQMPLCDTVHVDPSHPNEPYSRPFDKQLRASCMSGRMACKGHDALKVVEPTRLPEHTASSLFDATTRNGADNKTIFGYGHFAQDRLHGAKFDPGPHMRHDRLRSLLSVLRLTETCDRTCTRMALGSTRKRNFRRVRGVGEGLVQSPAPHHAARRLPSACNEPGWVNGDRGAGVSWVILGCGLML